MNQRAQEIFTQYIVPVIIIFQTDNLGMGMTLGTAGSGAVIAEIQDGLESFIRFQLEPVGKAERNDFMELFRRIGGEFPVMIGGLYNDSRPGLLKHGKFIHEPDQVALFLQNTR